MLFTKFKLISAMVRNARSTTMNRDRVGYTIERSFASITERDIKAYVEATRDDLSRYGDGNGLAPPFIMSRTLYPMFRHIVTLKGLGMNLLRMVHGEQSVMWYKPIRLGQKLTVRMSIRDIVDTPAGELANILTQSFVAGELVAEAVSGFLVRGTGTMPKMPQHGSEPMIEAFRVDIPTFEGQNKLYADVSGDRNFIHTSNFLARMSGLPRTIMHGVCVAAMVNNALVRQVLKGDAARLKSISARFANPVFPGDVMTLVGYKSRKKGEVPFEVFRASGKPVIRNGMFRFGR